tara:strand:+ start:215 stop:439 length:225 start_codon:yes stop_codon:yes gene_type:complete
MVNEKTKEKEKNMTNVFTEIDTNYQGTIPTGTDLVVVEMNDVLNGTFESALTLMGFDELGMFTDFENPVYGFLS